MHSHKLFTGIASGLSLALAAVFMATFGSLTYGGSTLEARSLLDRQTNTKWVTITEAQVESGATIPPDTNVFFTVPMSVDTIPRTILLGDEGKHIRYWGYCFPDAKDPENPPQSTGFPGKIFLSEKERAFRQAQADRQNTVSPFLPPVLRPSEKPLDPIRHQLEIFRGGMTCYIMSESVLPIGVDPDGDGINSQEEKKYQTNPNNTDTDGDGEPDSMEILYGTDPLRRDTDGDGILDGVEDANHNGRFDPGETDALKKDTDGDGLCDGLCNEYKVRKICSDNAGRQCISVPFGMEMGEDKNLNGKVESGETDPRKVDSFGDGVTDQQRFFRCLLTGKTNC